MSRTLLSFIDIYLCRFLQATASCAVCVDTLETIYATLRFVEKLRKSSVHGGFLLLMDVCTDYR